MKFSVIIPVYKNWEIFEKCYQRLKDQTFEESEIEILVINNSPENPVPSSLSILSNTKIIDQPIPGSYASRNLGVSISQGDILAFTDSDCLPENDWLEKAEKAMTGEADLIGGRVEVFKEDNASDLAYDFERTFGFNQRKNVEEKSQSVTANLIAKKNVFKKVGLFREDLLSGGDFEWTKRAVKSGFKLEYSDDVLIYHPARKSVSQIAQKRKRTSGGFYFREYKYYSFFERIRYVLVMGRPRLSILNYKDFGFKRRIELFFATWSIEIQGIWEILLLQFGLKEAERQ